MSVLFSPIGESDPIRNYYDGPLLHILRYYPDIDKIYIFLTGKMKENKEKVNRGLKETIKRNLEISYIESDIVAAHDYNIFYPIFSKKIKELRSENKDDLIYINISSGTPQMSVALALIASQEKLGKVKTIQVSRPCEDAKEGPRVTSEKYNIEEEIFFNHDNEVGALNRCCTVEITTILYNNLRERVETLVNRYDYATALELYNSSPINDNEVQNLLIHLDNRTNQQYDKAIEASKNLKYKDNLFLDMLVNKQNKRVASLFEMFLIINNLYLTNKMNDFLVRLCSYCESLQKELIYQLFDYDVETKFCVKVGKRQKLNRQKVEEYSPELLKALDECFHGYCAEEAISINAINVIINYEVSKRGEEAELFVPIFDKIEELKQYRHRAAHTLLVINKKQLDEKYNIKGLLDSIKKLLLKIAINKKISSKYFNLYDEANKYIIREMR